MDEIQLAIEALRIADRLSGTDSIEEVRTFIESLDEATAKRVLAVMVMAGPRDGRG